MMQAFGVQYLAFDVFIHRARSPVSVSHDNPTQRIAHRTSQGGC
jgi:hypothetical protein